MLIAGKDIRKIIYNSSIGNILIITSDDDTARQIRHEIADFMRWYISSEVRVSVETDSVNIGAFNPIYVSYPRKWNDQQRIIPFSGTVLITDKKLTDVRNLGKDVKLKYLPIEKE